MTLSALGILSAAGAGAAVAASSYELISSTVLGSNTPSVTFSSLGDYSSTYKHLQLRIVTKYDNPFDNFFMRLNGDTGSNYSVHRLIGNGSTVTSLASTSQSYFIPGITSSSTANIVAPTVIDILDSYSTAKNKTIRALSGDTADTSIRFASGAWYNTSSITSISLLAEAAYNFATGSRFSLYGIKG